MKKGLIIALSIIGVGVLSLGAAVGIEVVLNKGSLNLIWRNITAAPPWAGVAGVCEAAEPLARRLLPEIRAGGVAVVALAVAAFPLAGVVGPAEEVPVAIGLP